MRRVRDFQLNRVARFSLITRAIVKHFLVSRSINVKISCKTLAKYDNILCAREEF